jgi:threonine synthase
MSAHWSYEEMGKIIQGVSVSDDETRRIIAEVHERYGYFLDPHTAVGWEGVNKLAAARTVSARPLAVLSTAHPAKFAETVEPLTGPVPVPPSLRKVMERQPKARTIPADISALIGELL